MLKEQITSEIIRLMDLYGDLNQQEHFKQAGDVYKKLTRQVFKRLTQDMQLFKNVVDDLLFYVQKPYVQIEIATEAIGMNYRKEEAIKILEGYALWTPEMSLQNEKGRLCHTAQMRLYNLLGYSLNYANHTYERTIEQEITPVYKNFFIERSINRVDLNQKSIGYKTKDCEYIFISEIINIYSGETDEFLIFCLTKEEENCYLSISSDGEILQVYDKVSQMETFHNNLSIFYIQKSTDEIGFYGVMKRDGGICIPPRYTEMLRMNDFFFMGICSHSKGVLYNHSGQIIRENINPYEVIVNNSSTYIYQNTLYDENGKTIIGLEKIGCNWEKTSDLGEYVGFNTFGEIVYINELGQVLPFKDIDFETYFMLDKKGEFYILRNEGFMTLPMDDKIYKFNGDVHAILHRFTNYHFILQGDWEKGSYLWIDCKNKKFQFYESVHYTNLGYWFAKVSHEDNQSSMYWLIMDSQGNKCITEKEQIINVYESNESDSWILENAELEDAFYLPIKKKIIKKDKVIRNFIKKNRVK